MQTKEEIKARQHRYYLKRREAALQSTLDITGMVRVCSTCYVEKPLIEFRKNPTSKLGRAGQCMVCVEAKRNQRRPRIKERRRQLRKQTTGNAESIQNRLLKGARDRAKRKKLDFNIDLDDIVIPDTCPILGITLEVSDGMFCGSSPSLDRINNKFGYIKGNIAVISHSANSMKGTKDILWFEQMLTYMKASSI